MPKCTKFNLRQYSNPDIAGGAYNVPQISYHVSVFMRAYFERERGGKERGGKRREGRVAPSSCGLWISNSGWEGRGMARRRAWIGPCRHFFFHM